MICIKPPLMAYLERNSIFNLDETVLGQTGKNTHYAKHVHHSSMIEHRILGCVRRDMDCAECGASGLRNSWCTRESRHTHLVKTAQEGHRNSKSIKKKCEQKLGKLLTKDQQKILGCKKGQQNF